MPQKQLTALEWFEYLPDEIRDKAQAYCCEQESCVEYIYGSLFDAFWLAIDYDDTVEGAEHWTKILHRIKNNTVALKYPLP